jgi:hypothetical protein
MLENYSAELSMVNKMQKWYNYMNLQREIRRKQMKIWVEKAGSFEAAERFDKNYYLKMSREERLDTVQMLREMWFDLNKSNNENRKRLRRTVKVIKQK